MSERADTVASRSARDLVGDAAAWDAFVAAAGAPSYLQATPWAGIKQATGWRAERVAVDSPSGPVGAQILVRRPRPMPKGFGYAPRGPVAEGPLDEGRIVAFTGAVRDAAGRLGVSHVRIDPGLEDPDGRLAEALRGAGWRPAPEIQPRVTRLIDLEQPEEEIWAGIHRKWRQSITKGGRDDARVVPGDGSRIGEFHRIHVRSMERARLPHRTEGVYRSLWEAYAPGGHADLLFVENAQGIATATILLLGWGGHIADLYGGQTDEGARNRANYLVKWEAIRRAKAAGYRAYDLWGLPSEAVASFKAGWGGRLVEYVGSWDLVVDPLARTLFEAAVGARARLIRARFGTRDRTAAGGPAGD